MLDALERSLGAQRQLVMDASHELRTPLASLRTNVEVLNDLDRLSPQQREAVLSRHRHPARGAHRAGRGRRRAARGEAPASHHEEVRSISSSLVRSTAPAVIGPLSLPRRDRAGDVRGVPGRLDRAVANMLDNAGKFSPPDPSVDVDLASRRNADRRRRGPGVPDEALPHVFDRFYRADEARAMPGSGLGLAIVRRSWKGHGGRSP